MFIQRAFQKYKDFKSATAAAASVAGAHPPPPPLFRPYTPSQQVIVAACGAARCGYRFSFRYRFRFRFRFGFEFGHKKHFHFISFRCMRCELKGTATGEGGAKKYASGRNLCQVTQPGLGDECWAIQGGVGVGVVALMVATFYVPFSVEHRMLSQIFNASQGRVKRGEGQRVKY